MDNLGKIGRSLMDNWGEIRQLIAAEGSTLFLTLEVTIARKVLPQPQRMAACSIC